MKTVISVFTIFFFSFPLFLNAQLSYSPGSVVFGIPTWTDNPYNTYTAQTYRFGAVGIGTDFTNLPVPTVDAYTMLRVKSRCLSEGGSGACNWRTVVSIEVGDPNEKAIRMFGNDGDNNASLFEVRGDGTTYVGTSSDAVNAEAGTNWAYTEAKLFVNGKILSEELKVELFGNWPDYVFSPTYELMSLKELGQYIEYNRHLPGMPSAQQIEDEGGFEVGDMTMKLVEKTEELTLYILEQEERIERLEKMNQELLERLDASNDE